MTAVHLQSHVANLPEFTRVQVAQNTDITKRALIIIDNLVYDVTTLLSEHPGGEQVILEYIGRDATAGFEGVGHSKSARVWRDKLLVGKLIEADRA